MFRKALLFTISLLTLTATLRAAEPQEFTLWTSSTAIRGKNDLGDPSLKVGFRSGNGFGIGSTRWLTDHLALGVDVFRVTSRASLEISDVRLDLGRLRLTPIGANAQLHACRNCRIDGWLGAGAAYVMTGNLTSADLDSLGFGTVKVDDKIAPMATAGATLSLWPRVSIAAETRYMPLSVNARTADDPEPAKVKLNPLITSVGVRFRF